MMINLEENYKKLWRETRAHMLKTRKDKFENFLFFLCFFEYASLSHIRGTLMKALYTLFRIFDDWGDRDRAIPRNFSSPVDFLKTKIIFANTLKNPKDEWDLLLLYCIKLGKKLGYDFSKEIIYILKSILFDAERYDKMIIFPKNKLSPHFDMLDIEGTEILTIKVYGEKIGKYKYLIPLGLASRIYYNLRDLAEDIFKGFVNINLEDAKRIGITQEELFFTRELSRRYLLAKKKKEEELNVTL